MSITDIDKLRDMYENIFDATCNERKHLMGEVKAAQSDSKTAHKASIAKDIEIQRLAKENFRLRHALNAETNISQQKSPGR